MSWKICGRCSKLIVESSAHTVDKLKECAARCCRCYSQRSEVRFFCCTILSLWSFKRKLTYYFIAQLMLVHKPEMYTCTALVTLHINWPSERSGIYASVAIVRLFMKSIFATVCFHMYSVSTLLIIGALWIRHASLILTGTLFVLGSASRFIVTRVHD